MIEVNVKKKLKTYHGGNMLELKASFCRGSITQIWGPSGSGKTTLLKMIAGLIAPHEGEIIVDGRTWVNTYSKIDLPVKERNIGFVFQDHALFPNMTVMQHLLYGSADLGYIERLLEIGQLTAFAEQRPSQLSGGQQQRLGILRALVTKPSVLLMDEPFSALDKKLKTALLEDLKELFDELQLTCLVVTHDDLGGYSFGDSFFEMPT